MNQHQVQHPPDVNSLSGFDLAIFALYLGGTVLFGSWFVRRSRNTESFMAAGRTLPGWACGMSIFATYVSSISFLAIPGNAYQTNWNAFVFSLSLPLATWAAVRFFVPLYRGRGEVSAYSYLESRFGAWARTYASTFYLLTQLARIGSVMYLMALPLSALLGWDIRTIILITGVSVIIYTMLGGIEAVIWTDTIQGIVLTVGAVVCAVIIPLRMPEGPMQVFEVAAAADKFSLGSFGGSLTESTFWVVLVYGLFINLQNFGIDQGYIQRFISARDDRQATISAWLGGLLYLPVSAVFFFIGTALFAYYQVQPDLLPASLQPLSAGDRIFPHFIVSGLPTGVTGVLVAAIFAAAMSTVSTSLNSSATIILEDIYRRYVRPDAGEKASMRVLYGSTLGLGIVGLGIALAMIRVESALDVWWELASIFSGGMLGLFLLGYFSRRSKKPEAVMAVIVGVLVILWMSLPQWMPFPLPLHSYLTIVLGTTAIFLTGFLLTLLLQRFR
ncbi:MAG: sodium:solute symporter [Rhodothermales bacterium]